MIQNFDKFFESKNKKIELKGLASEYLVYLMDDNIIVEIFEGNDNVYEIKIQIDYRKAKWNKLLIWSNIKDDIVPFIELLQLKGYQILTNIGFMDGKDIIHYHNLSEIDDNDFQRKLQIMFNAIIISVI